MTAPLRETLTRALRLGLPLSAVLLLMTVFLVSRAIDPSSAPGIADMDPADLTREPRIATARFAGVTRDGTALTISAGSVRSGTQTIEAGPLMLTFLDPEGVMRFPDSSSLRFDASRALLDQTEGVLTAQGPVMLENSDGYDLELGALTAQLDQTRLTGTDGINGTAPAGRIRADALELTRSGGPDGGYRLAFTGNVRLLYSPD
ncbi:MAG: lipopolysaccharide export system permease component LptC [Roseibaca calidilacus]|uniref:Lipopolysaccharide export system permease component LptC n=1 Tax=Roseibaca calidilacus TaxID=1666912 RepID=A0A0P7WWS6_9RHOB|nr:hypothetical protein [Roseibaca calidilacus]KPP95722.1 MAG: lipopolysaccharide export system permease component LptC [Roseibaca calidilacus]CUX81819.1 lipopolysaccharide export system protein LptC [Roseibaca calidilacus]